MMGRLDPGAWRPRYWLGLWGRAGLLLAFLFLAWLAACETQAIIFP